MSKSNSVGTKLTLNGKTLGGLTSISGIEVSADTVDVTDLSNVTGYREKLPGWKDPGEVTAEGFLDGDDEGQSEAYDLLASGDVVDCQIVFPAKIGKTWKFKAGITGFSTTADVDNAVTFSATLAVSGQPTLEDTQAGG